MYINVYRMERRSNLKNTEVKSEYKGLNRFKQGRVSSHSFHFEFIAALKRNENDPVLKQQDREIFQTFEFSACLHTVVKPITEACILTLMFMTIRSRNLI